ncbi:MAG: hypothetical protein MHMPM18_004570, partial [Marteilia pararefringens]
NSKICSRFAKSELQRFIALSLAKLSTEEALLSSKYQLNSLLEDDERSLVEDQSFEKKFDYMTRIIAHTVFPLASSRLKQEKSNEMRKYLREYLISKLSGNILEKISR